MRREMVWSGFGVNRLSSGSCGHGTHRGPSTAVLDSLVAPFCILRVRRSRFHLRDYKSTRASRTLLATADLLRWHMQSFDRLISRLPALRKVKR